MTREDARSLIASLVKDTGDKLSRDDYDQALVKALAYYSQFRPNILSQTVACGANGRIFVSVITGFDEGFIEQLLIEYPIITVAGPPNWVDGNSWSYEQEDAGPLIRFLDYIPTAGASVRIVHRTKHLLPADDTDSLTVRESDTEAVCELAASEALKMLARLFTQTTDRYPQADFANFQNKSMDYESRAKTYRQAFYDHLNAGGRREYSTVSLARG